MSASADNAIGDAGIKPANHALRLEERGYPGLREMMGPFSEFWMGREFPPLSPELEAERRERFCRKVGQLENLLGRDPLVWRAWSETLAGSIWTRSSEAAISIDSRRLTRLSRRRTRDVRRMRIRREAEGRYARGHRAGAMMLTLIAGLALGVTISGCAYFASQPEINPDRYAPSAMGQQWQPKGAASSYEPPPVSVESSEGAAGKPQPGSMNQPSPSASAKAGGQTADTYDLASLIDLAMSNNPQERTAWESARAAAAAYGSARAPYYPLVTSESDNGYTRLQFQVAPEIGVVKQWAADPTIQLTYTLIDFGRRSANAAAARERLAAAGFSFNREIQDVVFGVEQAYYGLAAAQAGVTAAIQNLRFAQADFESAGQRMNLGLATAPEYLLAKERVAQADYDLANARLMVRDAQANLAVAAGVPANYPLPIETLERQPLPSNLGADVDALIEEARRERPDLAASMADVRTREAELAEANAQWYPQVEFNGAYGSAIYDYTFNGPPHIDAIDPQYAALVTLKWDLFTGFKRLNDIREAQAQTRASRAQVASLELSAYAQVWQAYYQFQSSLTKYQYAQALIDAAQESYAANSETYRQGLSTIVELLTADRDLANARYTLIQSRADLLTAAAAVAYASGSITFKPQP